MVSGEAALLSSGTLLGAAKQAFPLLQVLRTRVQQRLDAGKAQQYAGAWRAFKVCIWTLWLHQVAGVKGCCVVCANLVISSYDYRLDVDEHLGWSFQSLNLLSNLAA